MDKVTAVKSNFCKQKRTSFMYWLQVKQQSRVLSLVLSVCVSLSAKHNKHPIGCETQLP